MNTALDSDGTITGAMRAVRGSAPAGTWPRAANRLAGRRAKAADTLFGVSGARETATGAMPARPATGFRVAVRGRALRCQAFC